jgi:hypothetical protein
VQAAEQPDQQNDWQRNADEPKQQPTSHDILLRCLIKDCLITTLRRGSSIVAARASRRAGCQAGGRGYIALAVPGGVAEWLKALAWKACIRETVSWVRIPLPPPPPSERNRNPTCSICHRCHRPNFAAPACAPSLATPFPQVFAVRSARVQAQHDIFASLIIIRAGGDRRAQGTVGLGAEARSRTPTRG